MMTTTQTRRLSGRERELVSAVARGLSNREIAGELHLSEQTVKNQLTAIYQKIGVRSRLQLALVAMRNELAEPPATWQAAAG